MSGMAMEYVIQRMTGSPKARLLAVCLAHYVNNFTGKAFPGQKTLAKACGCGERTVRDAVRELEETRLFHRRARRNEQGERISDEYILTGFLEWREASMKLAKESKPTPENQGKKHKRQNLLVGINTTGNICQDNRQNLPGNKVIEQGSLKGADEPPSLNAMIWKEGKALMSCLSKPNHSVIGKWLKRTPSDEGKEKLLRVIRAAAASGTGDPVAYVTKAINEAFPPPPSPDTFMRGKWEACCTLAIANEIWSKDWGPPPGHPRCLIPNDLVTPELIEALAAI